MVGRDVEGGLEHDLSFKLGRQGRGGGGFCRVCRVLTGVQDDPLMTDNGEGCVAALPPHQLPNPVKERALWMAERHPDKLKGALMEGRRTSSSTLLRSTSRVSSTDTLISRNGKGSAAVAVELPVPGLDLRVQVRASRGPALLLRVPFGPLLLGRREGSPTAAVFAARDCILGLLSYQSD